ncbi:hypothetical protein FACS189483_03930 [Spirochaetia bacterium]|nr:hypothetical protein FACS189483_03930 [Spirochaetia bacterium]
MKKRYLTSGTLAVVLSAALAMTGCMSAPQAAPVSMPDKSDKPLTAGQQWLPQNTEPTAALVVSRGVNADVVLLEVEKVTLPEREAGTYWSPVDVPAGREIVLTVQFTASGYTSEAEFTIPPLTAGKTYILTFDEPVLKGKKMLVTNRRHWAFRGASGTFSAIFNLGIALQPTTVKSDAPKAIPSLLLYERTDNSRNKNKISLKLIYQYSLREKQGFPIP